MSTYILIIGLMLGNATHPIAELSGASFHSLEACESVRQHPVVIASYLEELGPNMRMWCERIGRNIDLHVGNHKQQP